MLYFSFKHYGKDFHSVIYIKYQDSSVQEMLDQRKMVLNEAAAGKGPVAYWMSRDQRAEDNWALIHAQELAIRQRAPLIVIFCLVPQFLNATSGHYSFMLTGLQEVSHRLEKLRIPFFLQVGEPGRIIPELIREHAISSLITDFDPLRVKRQWKKEVARRLSIPFYEVDTHNIVPCAVASPKQEYGAYTIRKKITKLLPVYLDTFPKLRTHPFPWVKSRPHIEWDKLPPSQGIDNRRVKLHWIAPGEGEARKGLTYFIEEKLVLYETDRNNSAKDAQSDLSPYLHFGQLSAQRVVLEIMKNNVADQIKAPFLEELIVRRELSDNFCFYNPQYDTFDGFPEWAKKTLNEHRKDRRPYLYNLEQFETAQTHDGLWNAAQMEMVKKGKMHGYMRMYWAKKILEWTPSPETAIEYAIYLNDKYELDGRDPNGYAGIAWSIGGVHDRAWSPRNVFGKIRYMSYNGCKSKFNINAYIEKTKSL
jgi:deoxyribodipyrimidine photo-lyase